MIRSRAPEKKKKKKKKKRKPSRTQVCFHRKLCVYESTILTYFCRQYRAIVKISSEIK